MFFELARLAVFLGLCLELVSGCEDGHHSRPPQRSAPLTPPTRPLQWGDVNVIHTTDTHGWLLGHQKKSSPEPNYR
jgi:2',3'-cyclic-nucleotide 2'-phosphodiesterase (5'-nucleotidase family)